MDCVCASKRALLIVLQEAGVQSVPMKKPRPAQEGEHETLSTLVHTDNVRQYIEP